MLVRSLVLATAVTIALASPVLAQVSPAEFEGPVSDFKAGEITVFNTKIALSAETTYSTPTREGLSITDILLNCKSFAGRKVDPETGNAWVGGTGIVAGDAEGTKVTGKTVFLEPAENVLIGQITAVPSSGGKFEISNTEVVVMPKVLNGESFPTNRSDSFSPCIPGLGVKNEFGFEIPTSSLKVGQDAVAEGWFANDGSKVFYAFLIDGVAQPDEGTVIPRQVSITRAQCRNRSGNTAGNYSVEWEIRGGVASPNNETVTIGYGNNQTAVASPDPANEPFGSWLYKARLNNQAKACPPDITVTYGSASASSSVEVRQ